jgi:hypothetical protein
VIAIEHSKSIRLKAIETDDFNWVFRAFGSRPTLNGASPKVLCSLLARCYELVWHDIPRKTIQVDFQMLEHAVEDADSFAKLFGITTVSGPSIISAQYPYTLTDVAAKIGKPGWHFANVLLQRVKADKAFDLKASDNKYHAAVKYGKKTIVHKYSECAIELLTKARDGVPYEI